MTRTRAGVPGVGRALVFALGLTCGLASQAQILPELRRNALDNDPAVAGALAQWRAAEQRVVQAQAGFGPVAGLAINKSKTRYNEAPEYDLRRYSAQQATLQITQPLLRTALWPALDAAQAQLAQAQAALDQARAESTVRLLEAGFDLLKARDTLTLIEAQRIAAEEQVASARRSFKVGRSTIVDVREAEAKIDTVAAQAIAAQVDLDLRQQLIAEQVGRPVPELLDRGLSGDLMPQLDAAAVLVWVAEAQLHSPQLQQARQALLTAEAEVRKAWHGHAPTADLSYTYTQSSDTGTVTSLLPRRGDNAQVGVSVNIPLFASGATQAKVREAMALRDKAQSDVDAARRSVQIGVRQSFTNTLGAVGLVRGLETATRSLEVALQANRRGYEVGMKVNADVLEAQTKIFESRRDLSRARYDAWLNFSKLKTFAGRLSDADIDQLDTLLLALPPSLPRGRNLPREVRP